eukprot:gnl/Trimastix_PCT/718.p1 GENE.gnl/Trimastix_PCT/718~~gnl/Trimastix_PCT/718.p1  ORF type:complete len:534 (+),score=163.38 gnl/Trimastix_PCT/718:51-1652(+)
MEYLPPLSRTPAKTTNARPPRSSSAPLSESREFGRSGQNRNRTSQIAPSIIPRAYHIVEKSPLIPKNDGRYTTEFHEDDHMWHTTIFPAQVPSSRQDVVLLEKWLDDISRDLESRAESTEPLVLLADTQKVFGMCFHEIVRQVSVHCTERGRLMVKLWRKYVGLFKRMFTMSKESSRQSIERLKLQYDEEVRKVQEENGDKIKKLHMLYSDEMKALLDSKEKVYQELEVVSEQLIQSKQEAEEQQRDFTMLEREIETLQDLLRITEGRCEELEIEAQRLQQKLITANDRIPLRPPSRGDGNPPGAGEEDGPVPVRWSGNERAETVRERDMLAQIRELRDQIKEQERLTEQLSTQREAPEDAAEDTDDDDADAEDDAEDDDDPLDGEIISREQLQAMLGRLPAIVQGNFQEEQITSFDQLFSKLADELTKISKEREALASQPCTPNAEDDANLRLPPPPTPPVPLPPLPDPSSRTAAGSARPADLPSGSDTLNAPAAAPAAQEPEDPPAAAGTTPAEDSADPGHEPPGSTEEHT